MPETPSTLFQAALRSDATRPFTTFHDDATSERVELSVATFDNWVAKTANLIQDELAAEPGERVALLLPAHWQTQVWLMACWSVGLVVVPGGDPAGADLVVSGPDTLAAALDCEGQRVALSLRPMGARFAEPPAGFLDYAAEVAGHGDRFVPYAAPRPTDPALELGGRTYSGADVAALGADAAKGWELGSGDRVLSSLGFTHEGGLSAGLLAPLAASVPVVLCRNLELIDESALERRISTERVTRTITDSEG
ncbi:TIGR03089 family protein [Yinghuangia seranimata]|uniref:TIGR03089 family protein n=1 Tax=Yinghuangia seranimata TaxID=408067 RepID=UPI00248CC50C|nr:TIGR03089 family protein [Yinghuangia seranimata]MDI2132249.1 TIGR03089 family protein [Yinghuangia seranimata]